MQWSSGNFQADTGLGCPPPTTPDVLEAEGSGGLRAVGTHQPAGGDDALAPMGQEPASRRAQLTDPLQGSGQGPTFTVWSSEAVATRARGPPKPQCRSVMGRVWRDHTCRGPGVREGSACSTLGGGGGAGSQQGGRPTSRRLYSLSPGSNQAPSPE